MTTGTAADGEAALDVSGVRKIYPKKVEALKGIELKVPKGCIFGLLGPNGAGKSTLIKILTTLIRPTACDGTMLGQPIGDRRTLKRVGLLPEHAQFPDYLTGRQVIEFSAGLSDVPAARTRKRTNELLELVGMMGDQHRKISGYSKGMKQRIGLAQALVNDPDIVFLDEPTDGVDPAGRRDFRDIIRHLKDDGTTVFVNTHILSELEIIADRVAILSKGVVLKQGTLSELRDKEPAYEISYEGRLKDDLIEALEGRNAAISGARIEVRAMRPDDVQPVLDLLRSGDIVISGLQRASQSLEDLFIEAVNESDKGDEENDQAGLGTSRPGPPPIK